MSANQPPVSVDDAITQLTAAEADENTAADAMITAYAGVPARIAAAVAAATATQLASFGALNTAITAESAKMKAALAAPTS